MHTHRSEYLDQPYGGGESWRQATARAGRFVADLPLRWSDQRVLVIGHVATRWGLDIALLGTPLEELAQPPVRLAARLGVCRSLELLLPLVAWLLWLRQPMTTTMSPCQHSAPLKKR